MFFWKFSNFSFLGNFSPSNFKYFSEFFHFKTFIIFSIHFFPFFCIWFQGVVLLWRPSSAPMAMARGGVPYRLRQTRFGVLLLMASVPVNVVADGASERLHEPAGGPPPPPVRPFFPYYFFRKSIRSTCKKQMLSHHFPDLGFRSIEVDQFVPPAHQFATPMWPNLAENSEENLENLVV